MGEDIWPNKNCGVPVVFPALAPGTLEACIASCTDAIFCDNEWDLPCIGGGGACTYGTFAGYCKWKNPFAYDCYCFPYLKSHTCSEADEGAENNAGLIPNEVLYDYNLCRMDGTVFERYVIDNQYKVVAYRNIQTPMNIAVKLDMEHWV